MDNKVPNPGYHLFHIPKGDLGEVSKIVEEALELQDAFLQEVKIMQLIELSDLIGAIESFLDKHFPEVSLRDLKDMSKVTKRAFINGHRN